MSSCFCWLTLRGVDWFENFSFHFLFHLSLLFFRFSFLYIFLFFYLSIFHLSLFLFFSFERISYILLSLKDSKVKYKIFVSHIFCEDLPYFNRFAGTTYRLTIAVCYRIRPLSVIPAVIAGILQKRPEMPFLALLRAVSNSPGKLYPATLTPPQNALKYKLPFLPRRSGFCYRV